MRSQRKFIIALVLASLVGVILFAIGAVRNDSLDYWYLPVNFALALIPLAAAVWLRHLLGKRKWSDWRVVLLGLVWLLFLPNSFYIVTDFIHLPEIARTDLVQDVVMLMQFSVMGLIAGFTSLYILHSHVLKRVGARNATMMALVALYLSSFAIYLGRELRWNSWDVVAHPFLVAKDVLTLWWNPTRGGDAAWMTISFFIMLVSLYLVLWYGVQAAGTLRKN